jgi:hypothetical protein
MACQEATETCLESNEPTSLEVDSVVVHQEVPKEEVAMDTFGALKKRHGDRHLAVGRRRRTQGNGGSREKLAVACRGVIRCAGIARHK